MFNSVPLSWARMPKALISSPEVTEEDMSTLSSQCPFWGLASVSSIRQALSQLVQLPHSLLRLPHEPFVGPTYMLLACVPSGRKTQ